MTRLRASSTPRLASAFLLTTLLPALLSAFHCLAQTPEGSATVAGIVDDLRAGQVQAMKLVAPEAGWALQQSRLYWTLDNGRNWRDITPGESEQLVQNVFFLNVRQGWAFLFDKGTGTRLPSAYLASTQNAGETWQVRSISADVFPEASNFASAASIYFVDTMNGWLVSRLGSSSNFSFGVLLATHDGGINWEREPTPPAAGEVKFDTPLHGWMIGGPASEGLWITMDGGKNWASRKTPMPDNQVNCQVKYIDFDFFGGKDGILAATIDCQNRRFAADYRTNDDAASWQMGKLENQNEAIESYVVGTISGGNVIRIASSQKSGLVIAGLSGQVSPRLPAALWPNGVIVGAAFRSDLSGWLLYSAGRCARYKTGCVRQSELLATSDGGRTLSVISPPLISQVAIPAKPGSVATNEVDFKAPSVLNLSPSLIGTNSQVLKGEGFDVCAAPSQTQMQEQWGLGSNNPYKAIGIYLGGETASCPQPNLNSGWVTQVTQEGWGLIPLWVGPQAVSGCSVCKETGGAPCPGMSTNLAIAAQQAVTEADSAASAATNLGISSTIIYYDLEPYGLYFNTNCTGALQTQVVSSSRAFVNSWVQELHSKGFDAGIYGHYKNASDWNSSVVANQPDAAWISDYNGFDDIADQPGDSTKEPGLYDAFNSNTGIPWWQDDARIHQWCSGNSGAGACSTFPYFSEAVDGNAISGPVFLPNTSQAPSVSTGAATAITTSNATLNGTVNPNGADTSYLFLYGTSSSLANAASTGTYDIGTVSGQVSGYAPGLNAGTTYYYQLQAWNSVGDASGAIKSFSTPTSSAVLTVTVTGNGNVQSTDGHINCPETCSYSYPSGASVALTANPASGWYDSWSGCDGLLSGNCVLTMSQTRTASVTFVQEPTSVLLVLPSALSFRTATGTQSQTQAATAINNGPAGLDPLSVSVIGAGAGSFSQTNNCPTYGLNGGSECVTSVTFRPIQPGIFNASLSISSANATVTQQFVPLTGVGTIANPITPTVLVIPSATSIATTQSLTVTVAVEGTTGNPTPTGSVTLGSGMYSPTPMTLVNGSAKINIPAGSLATGNDLLSVAYNPDINGSIIYNGNLGSASVIVTATAPATAPVFSPSAGTYDNAQTVAISDSISGAQIYYTLNGSTPTASSTKYTAPVSVKGSYTLQAIAIAPGYAPSSVASATYTLAAAPPVFSPLGGSYATPQVVSISSASTSATICYTTNGGTPTANSTKYSGPITVGTTETIKAIAVATGYTSSPVVSETYSYTSPAPAPTFSPAAGVYNNTVNVTLQDSAQGASFYYTLSGKTPTTASTKYSGPIAIKDSYTLQAIATAPGFGPSPVASATYTLVAATPVVSLPGSAYAGSQTVTITTASTAAALRYTTNGATPTGGSTPYTGPITIGKSETLKVIAVATGYTSSPVVTEVYTIQ